MPHGTLAALVAATPVVSGITSIVAVTISTTTAIAAARVAKKRAAREARAVAYAISPAVVAMSIQCSLAAGELESLLRNRGHEVGQTVAGEIASVVVDIPAMLDRHLDRVGALPETVGRDCLDLVTSVLALRNGTAFTVNRIGVSDRNVWHPMVEHHIKLIVGLKAQADLAARGLDEVVSRRIR